MASVQKRAAGVHKSGPLAKKPKEDPTLKPIVDAIEHDEANLDETTRKMLLAGLSGSFGVDVGERHALQTMVVDMVGEVIGGVDGKLKANREASEAKISNIERSKKTDEAVLSGLEVALAQATEAIDVKKASLAEASKLVANAKAAVSEQEQAQQESDAVNAKLQATKTALEKGIADDLKVILEGIDETDMAAHFTALQPILKGLVLDSSLVSALPACCTKLVDSRGSFDKMAIDMLQQTMSEQMAKLEQQLADGAPAIQEKASAVAAAKEQHVEMVGFQQKASEEVAASVSSQRDASVAVSSAKAALKASGSDYQKAIASRDAQIMAIQNFRMSSLATFEALRIRGSTPPASVEKDTNFPAPVEAGPDESPKQPKATPVEKLESPDRTFEKDPEISTLDAPAKVALAGEEADVNMVGAGGA